MSDKFLDKLHADPSIATCSVLASQLAANAEELLALPTSQTPESQNYLVADGNIQIKSKPSSMHALGTTACKGFDVRLVGFGAADAVMPKRGMYSLLRGNVLLEIARFARVETGPCNYIQFPGEISEGMVLTPLDAEKRKPILEEMKTFGSTEKVTDFHKNAKKGDGLALSPFTNEKMKWMHEYILCPETDLLETGQKLIEVSDGDINLVDEYCLVYAYAEMMGRAHGPFDIFFNNTYYTNKNRMLDTISVLRKEPSKITNQERNITGFAIGPYFRSLLPQATSAQTLEVPHLETVILEQFKQVFGVDHDPLHEKVLNRIFGLGSAIVSKTAENGFISSDQSVSADVNYTLTIKKQEDEAKRTLQLFAQITTMNDLEPTPCGTFIADQFGGLEQIDGKGASPLVASQLAELDDILTGEVTVLTESKTVAIDTGKKRRIFFGSK